MSQTTLRGLIFVAGIIGTSFGPVWAAPPKVDSCTPTAQAFPGVGFHEGPNGSILSLSPGARFLNWYHDGEVTQFGTPGFPDAKRANLVEDWVTLTDGTTIVAFVEEGLDHSALAFYDRAMKLRSTLEVTPLRVILLAPHPEGFVAVGACEPRAPAAASPMFHVFSADGTLLYDFGPVWETVDPVWKAFSWRAYSFLWARKNHLWFWDADRRTIWDVDLDQRSPRKVKEFVPGQDEFIPTMVLPNGDQLLLHRRSATRGPSPGSSSPSMEYRPYSPEDLSMGPPVFLTPAIDGGPLVAGKGGDLWQARLKNDGAELSFCRVVAIAADPALPQPSTPR